MQAVVVQAPWRCLSGVAVVTLLLACGSDPKPIKTTAEDTDGGRDLTPPVVTLLVPQGGEVLSGTVSITWSTGDPNPGSVEIMLSSDSGLSFDRIIALAAPDTGTFQWNTTSLQDRTTYRLQVIATDRSGNVSQPARTPFDFAVDNAEPSDLVITAPVGGAVWAGTRNLMWLNTSPNPATVRIELSPNSGATFPILVADAVADTGVFAWNTTAVANGSTYRLRVVPTDAGGAVGVAGVMIADFAISNLGNNPAALDLLSPNGGEVWAGIQEISWSYASAAASTVEIRLSADSGVTYPLVLAASAPDTGSYSWDTGEVDNGAAYRVRVTPLDALGLPGQGDESVGDFSVMNNVPPPQATLTVVSPNGGEAWSGVRSITWTNTDASKSTVAIALSSDAGLTFPTTLAVSAPDTGAFLWSSASVPNGSAYRVRITPSNNLGQVGIADASNGSFVVSNTAQVPAGCGNGIADGLEPCDGSSFAASSPGSTCAAYALGSGSVTCTADCRPNFAGCSAKDYCAAQAASLYGNGACDPCHLLGGQVDQECASLCAASDGSCKNVHSSLAGVFTCAAVGLTDPDCGVCGNGALNTTELCDGLALNGKSCSDFGYVAGTLGCGGDCRFAFNSCRYAVCGDGVRESGEVCDGADLGGATCANFGKYGQLSCTSCQLDPSTCHDPECGDGVAEGTEPCDGSDIRDFDCQVFNPGLVGTPTCTGDCALTAAGCSVPVCQDGVAEGAEECDGTDMRGKNCTHYGYTNPSGPLLCNSNCTYNFSVCGGTAPTPYTCGDGIATGLEVCDVSGGSPVWNLFLLGLSQPPTCAQLFGAGSVPKAGFTGPTCNASVCKPSTASCTFGNYCQTYGLYSDFICDLCEFYLGSPADTSDCNRCGLADGWCPERYDPLLGVFTCQAKGEPDPDCSVCGDKLLEEDGELCEGALPLNGCAAYGFSAGELRCQNDAGNCMPIFTGCEQ